MNRLIAGGLSRPAPTRSPDRSALLDPKFISAVGPAVVLTIFQFLEPRLVHWMALPLWACGALVVVDAVRWLRGTYDTFDPRGLVGLLGVHVFFLAPLLFIYWDLRVPFITNPDQWRPWIGLVCSLNVLGLLAYRSALHLQRRRRRDHAGTTWVVSPSRFLPLCVLLIFAGLVAQGVVLARAGGVAGLIREVTVRTGSLEGAGWLLMLGEAVPILVFIALTHFRQQLARRRALLLTVASAFLLFTLLVVVFAGVRGSRTAMILPLFWAVGIVHFLWRPVSAKVLMLALVPFTLFMLAYGFYKTMGAEAIRALKGEVSIAELQEAAPSRNLQQVVTGDLARASVQGLILYRMSEFPQHVDLGLGRTYVGALALVIPQSVWPGRPVGKVKEGTEVLYGKEAYASGLRSTRVYGLLGEALLNFGMVGVPLAFFAWGTLVGWLANWLRALPDGDARYLLLPLAVYYLVSAITGDSDLLVFGMIKSGAVATMVVFLGSRRMRNPGSPTPARMQMAVSG